MERAGKRASYTLGALSDASSDPETNLQPNANGECAFHQKDQQICSKLIMHTFRGNCLMKKSGGELFFHSPFHGTSYKRRD